MEFEQARSRLADVSTERGVGVPEAEIIEAESLIGAFPRDFRQYLSEFGWVAFKHYEVYGLRDSVPAYLNVVRMTLSERQEPAVPLPSSYVCVMNDGAGNLFCFDSRQVVGAGAIAMRFWDHELGVDQESDIVAESFADWLMELIRE